MFGMPKWKSQVRKKALEERSPAVRDILEGHDIHPDFEFIEKVEAEVGIYSHFFFFFFFFFF